MEVKVSVVIPVYNRSKDLIRAIKSVQNQTIQEFEVLVVDDKSEENIELIVNEFSDPRLKYFLNTSANSNANVCRNIGFDNASGDYIAMLDSDDEWLPNHLETKIKFITDYNCDGVFGSALVDNGEGRTTKISRSFGEHENMANYLLSGGNAPTPTHVYVKRCAVQVRWDEALERHQDYDFSIRFSDKFSFKPSQMPTAVIHWAKGDKRNEHIKSQIAFIEKHKDKLTPQIYNKYHRERYSALFSSSDISKDIMQHYRKQGMKHTSFVSLADFNDLYPTKGLFFNKILNRIRFVFKIILR